MLELAIAITVGLLAIVQAGVWIAIGVSRRAVVATPYYLLALAIGTIMLMAFGLISIPALIILKVVTGWSWAVYVAAFLAVAYTIILGLLWSPAAVFIGTILDPIHPIIAGRRYVRGVGIILFAELILSIGILAIPFHQNLGMLPIFFLVGATVVIATLIWGGYLGARFYQGIATVTFLLIILSFFLPRTFNVVREKAGKIDENLAASLSGEKKEVDTAIRPTISACYDAQNIVAKGKNEIIVRPNCWSGNISIPPQSWFRIVPEGNVTIRSWSGRVIHDGPGQDNWLGDIIRDGNFRIISDEAQPVKVAIITRSK